MIEHDTRPFTWEHKTELGTPKLEKVILNS